MFNQSDPMDDFYLKQQNFKSFMCGRIKISLRWKICETCCIAFAKGAARDVSSLVEQMQDMPDKVWVWCHGATTLNKTEEKILLLRKIFHSYHKTVSANEGFKLKIHKNLSMIQLLLSISSTLVLLFLCFKYTKVGKLKEKRRKKPPTFRDSKREFELPEPRRLQLLFRVSFCCVSYVHNFSLEHHSGHI